MNSKLFKAGRWLANGNDNVVAASKTVVRSTQDGVRSFIAGYKAQRLANARGTPRVEYIELRA